MENLAREVQNKIFSFLSYKDKFPCLFVSKEWNKFVQPYLVEIVDVRPFWHFESMIQYFEKYPDLQKCVKQLKISESPEVVKHMDEFPEMFPNVSKFTIGGYDIVGNFNYASRKKVTPRAWESVKELDLTEIVGEDKIPVVLERLLYNDYPNVTDLTITRTEYSWDYEKYILEFFTRLFQQLSKLPQLKNLTFKQTISFIEDLETLHKNSPNLKSLTFRDAILYTSNSGVTPKPTYLDSLDIELKVPKYGMSRVLLCIMFEYIAAKYKGLTSLSITYKITREFQQFYDDEAIDYVLLPLFDNNPQLTKYDQMLCPLFRETLIKMDQCGIQLKELTLYLQHATQTRQFRDLFNSRQIRSITHLIVTDIDMHHRTYTDPLPWIKRMDNLKHLTVKSLVGQYDLGFFEEYLTELPQLTSLTFCDVCVDNEHGEVDNSSKEAVSIKKIKLEVSVSNDEMQSADSIFKSVLPRCIDLESFGIDLDLQESSTESPYSLHLDFSNNKKLKSIDISLKDENVNLYSRYSDIYFEIIGENTDIKKYYRYGYDSRSKYFDKVSSIPDSHPFYITIVLTHPVLINSFTV